MKRFTTAAAALIGVAALLLGMSLSASADHGGGKAAAGAKAHGPLNSLVTAGTITQADATAVKAAVRAVMIADRPTAEVMKNVVATVTAKLVADGKLTTVKAEAINAAVAAKAEAHKSKRPGMKSNHGRAGNAGTGHGFKGEGRKAMRS
jgi:phosphopantothenate synthetase